MNLEDAFRLYFEAEQILNDARDRFHEAEERSDQGAGRFAEIARNSNLLDTLIIFPDCSQGYVVSSDWDGITDYSQLIKPTYLHEMRGLEAPNQATDLDELPF